MTPHRTALSLVAAALLVSGCSSGTTSVASDPAPTTVAPATPTAAPTVGTYPHFAPQDYAFTLEASCFCAGGGPIRVVVVDGAVTSATYLGGGGGKGASVEAGTPAPDYRRLSIDDVIDLANDTTAAHVDVVWPPGQDHPSSVYVDRDEQIADEEVGYAITDVVVAPS